MDSDRWKQVDSLLQAVLERPPEERDAFLRRESADDPALEREVRSLLMSQQQAGSFLESPAIDVAAGAPGSQASAGSKVDTSVGDKLGPYKIESRLGSGGMGDVYKAFDTRLGRAVAIKVSKEQFSERFDREARAIAALNHPNICTLHDVGPNYLVMELVEGPTLADRIKPGPVPLAEALRIARQIADALEAAHEKGIVHRDLKPGNIKVKRDGTVKVLDFGLATRVGGPVQEDSTATMTTPGTILGTAAYMAPEQARGEVLDKRADIWAFGVVLYEMLTGKQPFAGATMSDTLAEVLKTEPDLKQVPPQTEKLLRRCLEKDSRRRLRDIGDAQYLLEESAPQATPAVRATPWWKIVAGTLAAALVIALLALWRSEKPVERPLIRLDASLGPDAIGGANPSVAISPDGTRIVFPIRGPGGKPMLATRLLNQAAITPLHGTENAYTAFFSPDGQWIGFAADNKLKKVSLHGGTPVTLADASAFSGASWGEDGDIVASLSVTGGLVSIPASGAPPHAVTSSGKGEINHLFPQVLPGGNTVLDGAKRERLVRRREHRGGFAEKRHSQDGPERRLLRPVFGNQGIGGPLGVSAPRCAVRSALRSGSA
jgi:protein kinase-like protein/WD40 repeat protein